MKIAALKIIVACTLLQSAQACHNLNIADTLVQLDRDSEAAPYYEYYLELYPDSPVKDRVMEALNS